MSQIDKDLTSLSQNSLLIADAAAAESGVDADGWDTMNQELLAEVVAEEYLSEETQLTETAFDRKLAQYDNNDINSTDSPTIDEDLHGFSSQEFAEISDDYEYSDYSQAMMTTADEVLYTSPATLDEYEQLDSPKLTSDNVEPVIITASNIIDLSDDFDIDEILELDAKRKAAEMPKKKEGNTEEIIADLIKKLNDEQKSAALATEGPVIVIAGAGAGKTNTLIHRVAILIEKGIEPGNIMIVTFTKKAANEIKERLYGMVGEMALHINAGTFHSIIFSKILKRATNSEYLISENIDIDQLAIIDEKDSLKWFKESISELHPDELRAIDDNDWKPADFLGEMSMARAVGMDHKAYQRGILPGSKNEMFEHLLCRVWKKYSEKCRFMNGIDFDDILVVTNNLLRAEPKLAHEFGKEFRYLHLDEYQDTNPVQMAIMDSIAKSHRNIFVVGDEKQSIYKFRGADINVILSFEKRYTEATKVTLNKNYRSNASIIALANIVAHEMPQKLSDGQLDPQSDRLAAKPSIVEFETTTQEAQTIAQAIQRDIRKGVDPEEIAVLYRQKSDKIELERELVRLNVDYQLTGDTSFYKRAEVKDMIAAIRFMARPWDNSAGLRLLDAVHVGAKIEINTPSRGMIGFNSKGASTVMSQLSVNVNSYIEQQVTKAEKKHKEMEATHIAAVEKRLAKGDDAPPTKTELNKEKSRRKSEKEYLSIRGFQGMLNIINEAIEDNGDPDTIKEQIEHFWSAYMRPKIEKELTGEKAKKQTEVKKNKERNDKILDNVRYLSERFAEGLKAGTPVDQIIDDLALMIDGQSQEEVPSVQLMTMHASKGLEFDKCYLIGMEANENLDPAEKLEDYNEERRIVYVAITRGKDNVTISFANLKKKFGAEIPSRVSPFIEEIMHKDPTSYNYVDYRKYIQERQQTTSKSYGR